MTCHFYYHCDKCDHEEPDEGNEDMKNYICHKCGSHVVCTRKNQVIYCDFKHSEESKRIFRHFIP